MNDAAFCDSPDMADQVEQAALAMIRSRHIGYGPVRNYVRSVIDRGTNDPSDDLIRDILDRHLLGRLADDGEPILVERALDLCAAVLGLAWDVAAYRRTGEAQELIDGMVRFVSDIESAHASEIQRLRNAPR